MKINEVTLLEAPRDPEREKKRTAALDKDGKKVLWKNLARDETKVSSTIEVDGVEYKVYVDLETNQMRVWDAQIGGFVIPDQNFVRRATGKNLSARFKQALKRVPGLQTIRNLFKPFDPDDMTKPGAAQVAKSTNWLGQRSARFGGRIDNYFARRKQKNQLQNEWTRVYGIQPPKPNDDIVWLTADGKKATGKLVTELADTDGDGVPELNVKMAQGTTAIRSSSVISINGVELKRKNKQNMRRVTTTDPGDAGIRNVSTGNDPAQI